MPCGRLNGRSVSPTQIADATGYAVAMRTVFLCHATRDKAKVRRIARDLERYGVHVWLDEREIHVGDSLRETIETGIERADYVAVALSRAAVKREWVKKEISAAFALENERKRKVLLPVLLEKSKVPLFLRDKKYADFSKGYSTALDDLVEAIVGSRIGEQYQVETVRCTVRLDVKRTDGSLLGYTKQQVHRAWADRVTSYVEALSADGELRDFEVTPGSIGSVWRESGVTHVMTLFPAPLRVGKTLERTFSCTYVDSFTSQEEYWEERQHYPSSNVTVLIIFPKTRPPKTWRGYEKKGPDRLDCSSLVSLSQESGRPVLRLHVAKPRLLSSYVVRWTW